MSMRKTPSSRSEGSTPPATTPSESSSSFGSGDHSFTLQAIMQMQGTLGKLDHAVESLIECEKESRGKLARIEKVLYAAGIVMIIVLGVGGWLLSTAKDFVLENYKASLEIQKSLVQDRPAKTDKKSN